MSLSINKFKAYEYTIRAGFAAGSTQGRVDASRHRAPLGRSHTTPVAARAWPQAANACGNMHIVHHLRAFLRKPVCRNHGRGTVCDPGADHNPACQGPAMWSNAQPGNFIEEPGAATMGRTKRLWHLGCFPLLLPAERSPMSISSGINCMIGEYPMRPGFLRKRPWLG